jgi:lipopolysaccharide export system permease protein
MDYIISGGLEISAFLQLILALAPSLLIISLPIGLLCGLIYGINNMLLDNELTIMQNAGLSNLKIAISPLIIGIIFCIISFFLNLYAMPKSYAYFKDMQNNIRSGLIGLALKEQQFNNPSEGMTVFIKEQDAFGIMHGIFIHDARKEEPLTTISAQKAYINEDGDNRSLILINGTRQEKYIGKKADIIFFQEYSLSISDIIEGANLAKKRYRNSKEMSISELLNPQKVKPNIAQEMRADAHQRLSWPLISLVLPLMVSLIMLHDNSLGRRINHRKIIITCLSGAALIVSMVMIKSFVIQNNDLIFLFYLVPAISLIIASSIGKNNVKRSSKAGIKPYFI